MLCGDVTIPNTSQKGRTQRTSRMASEKEDSFLKAIALTASADVPSSVTETTDTTSTLPPPPPPLQKPTGHRDIRRKLKIRNLECIISGRLKDIGYQLIKRSE
ncbi:hypothetical protein Tco_0093839 [Tanacetum coccineum]